MPTKTIALKSPWLRAWLKGKTIRWIGRAFLGAFLFFLLYWQLNQAAERLTMAAYEALWASLTWSDWSLLALVLALMPLNWGFELLHWRGLLRPEIRPSWRHSLRAILAGIFVSLFTPNRLGETGTRAYFLPKGRGLEGWTAGGLGTAGRWLVLTAGGSLALASGLLPWQISPFWLILLKPALALYLALPGLLARPAWQFLARRLNYRVEFEVYYTPKVLIQGLLWAILRYGVYSAQYMLILYALGWPDLGLLLAAKIALLFLCQTGFPLPPGLGLAARGSLALLLLSWGLEISTLQQSIILTATFLLWSINLFLPAIAGAFVWTIWGAKEKN